MPTYSQGPRHLNGAIVAIDLATSKQTTIAFQYNPETLTRTLTPQYANKEDETQQRSQRSAELRFTGAPKETFTLDISLDASDYLEKGDATAADFGIYPQLSALEVLAYPRSNRITESEKLSSQGKMEVASYPAPLTLLVWGSQRVVPVQLTSITVTESIFDDHLNPIQATVKLSMSVLSYSDLDPSHKGYNLFLAYHQKKEEQAGKGQAKGNIRDLLGVDVR